MSGRFWSRMVLGTMRNQLCREGRGRCNVRLLTKMRNREQKQDGKKSKIGKLKFEEQVKERIDSWATRPGR
jgi:hypothetical protein